MKLPQRMEKYYPMNFLLLLLRTLYGLRQADEQFWNKLIKHLGL